MSPETRAHVHELIDSLPPVQLAAIETLLESMIDDDDQEELTEEDRRALTASKEFLRKGGKGIPLEQVAADLGFTMDQIRGSDHQ